MSRSTVTSTKEQIEKRAYEFYLARGCEPGREMEDWVVAEKELALEEELSQAEPEQNPSPRKARVSPGRRKLEATFSKPTNAKRGT
jgi:hypothetical protein